MDRDKSRRSPPNAAFTWGLVFLLLVCLAECASEQRINRGNKASNLVQKINGWRSQRGGSCLSYGHSCWGAHGKRSAKAPGPLEAPDWFITKLLRRMDTGNEMNRMLRQAPSKASRNNDINAIYQPEGVDDSGNSKLRMEDDPLDLAANRNPEAKPMLDNELLNKIKIWQIMVRAHRRDASEE